MCSSEGLRKESVFSRLRLSRAEAGQLLQWPHHPPHVPKSHHLTDPGGEKQFARSLAETKLEFFQRNFYFGKEKKKSKVNSQVSHPNGVVTG